MAKLVNFRKKKQILKITKPYHSAKVIEQFLREFGIRLKKRRTDRQTRVKPKPHFEKWGSKKNKQTNKKAHPLLVLDYCISYQITHSTAINLFLSSNELVNS